MMRHLEARGFQDFAKIGKEFAAVPEGPPVAADMGRHADTTIRLSEIQGLRDHLQDHWELTR